MIPYGIVEFYVIKRIYEHRCYFYHSSDGSAVKWTRKEDNAFLFDNEEQAIKFRRSQLAKRDCAVSRILDYLKD